MRRILELLELMFRRIVVYPVLRLVFRNARVELPLDRSRIGSILILRYDKIGDMVVTIPVVRVLKDRMPGVRLAVLGSESNIGVLDGETAVDNRFVLYRNPLKLVSELVQMRAMHFDVVLNFIFNRTTSGALISNFVSPKGVKVGQGAERYRFYFNVLMDLGRSSKHMLDVLLDYVESVFGLTAKDHERRLAFSPGHAAEQSVSQYLREHGLRRKNQGETSGESYCVFNISAGELPKQITMTQAVAVGKYVSRNKNMTVVIIAAPVDTGRRTEVVRLVHSAKCLSFPRSGSATLHQIASLLEGAAFVITPDTSIVHFASAVGTPIIGFFTPLQIMAEWIPYKVDYAVIQAPRDQPVSAIEPPQLTEGIESFMNSRWGTRKNSPKTR